MESTESRVVDLIAECQRFAGHSSLATTRHAQTTVLEEFVSRLPDARNPVEELMFRGVLLDAAMRWAMQVHTQFHKSEPEPCEFTPIDELWPYWKDRTLTAKLAFARSGSAFLSRFDLAHPLCASAKAKEIIDQRYSEPIIFEDLARMTGCHPTRLRVSFKETFGVTLREYLTKTRVLHAAELVTSSDLKIDAIAAAVGFRSRRRFYDAFRRVVGCTPSEMRTRSAGDANVSRGNVAQRETDVPECRKDRTVTPQLPHWQREIVSQENARNVRKNER